jgi:cyclopropane fatty-acyl-phospholipid synthase-like methyltransferase
LYKDTFAYLLETLPQGGTVLELGCGPGNVVKYLRTQRPDLHFLGIDLAPEMLNAARAQNPEAEFRLMDLRHADQLTERFDAVVAAFCMPYVLRPDVEGVLAHIHELTVKGSLVYVSCMEGKPERSGFEKTSFTGDSELFITYYQREELALWMKDNGFTIKRFYTKDYPEPDGSTTTDLVYIAEKG